MKKFSLSFKHFFIEAMLAVATAFLFGLFAWDFLTWLGLILVLLLVWHHYNEQRLLHLIDPNRDSSRKVLTTWEHISQTVAFYQKRNRREKIKTLRLLSKLNRNIQYLPDGIIICNHAGTILWCNNASQEILKFYWDKKLEKSVFNVIFYEEFKKYFHQNKKNRPLVLMDSDGRYIEFHLNDYDSESYLIIARDVTQMIRLLHSRQMFLTNMNHELRTPLTVLRGYLELLEGQAETELQQKSIHAMQSQAKRMGNLLDQLNLLAKIETSSSKEHYVVEMSAMISALQKNADFLNQSKQQIIFNITPNITVLGDETQLQSAVSNLIYNAVKHAGDGATIEVDWHWCEEGAEFSVKDNGIGIEDEHLPHLTERFYRVDESRSNQTGGSGLGLAIVKYALEQHGSQIKSEFGKGSRFSFIIKKSLLGETKNH
ncbi:phosphate regulon sensor histidine kinase PhoR [Actinobacillus pleuropneumoniae]|uniref:phosphate regulon sensor histidine kinase PhoR n=1 Tax=Actinobacillus pleuropneumoniae TaxID=715 RepID=UPI001EEDB97C|nr:phosphate regulon sensor histidine kinase PhoR [Actinobacillus pleuropneumoniae]UKH16749.1 two-component system sensor histidine kinase PhoR [Actinobacillus pleuropneumoniae]